MRISERVDTDDDGRLLAVDEGASDGSMRVVNLAIAEQFTEARRQRLAAAIRGRECYRSQITHYLRR